MTWLPIFYQDDRVLDGILKSANASNLPIDFKFILLDKLNNKSLNRAFFEHDCQQAMMAEGDRLYLVHYRNNELIKVTNDWQALTKRIVSAGRKSELLLQAVKLTSGQTLIDGTAGFGHDSLILASTGANVVMCENNPIMALMLAHEYRRMQSNVNWQGLLSRIQIRHSDLRELTDRVDVVYLDPMFPEASYSAKVAKTMQALHHFVAPPNSKDEIELLSHAIQLINDHGRVIVKRPVTAPHLANQIPSQSWQNDALRFDKYDACHQRVFD